MSLKYNEEFGKHKTRPQNKLLQKVSNEKCLQAIIYIIWMVFITGQFRPVA